MALNFISRGIKHYRFLFRYMTFFYMFSSLADLELVRLFFDILLITWCKYILNAMSLEDVGWSWLSTNYISLSVISQDVFKKYNVVVFYSLLHDFEFRVVVFLDWLPLKARESSRLWYLTHAFEGKWVSSVFHSGLKGMQQTKTEFELNPLSSPVTITLLDKTPEVLK